ncbi:folylpolyglutamate synthase/dihydrofolate synthase family protein [uncultured Pseudoteredinibacter sp.]|uniref:bifunctional folylpolyglutamate synthase/dihydrofolate synthase n=1 Tax=uncultured Pseudoteredinibacter sp. TaxID=1641701 RepID=UPI0026393DC6|nr:folylpolyglutamate synthase/dihydrofolate synthase family protein [uncultured Pseudoteredinibacter sp.]
MSDVPNERSLSQWLQYIEALHPSEIDMGLGRVREVAERMALPEQLSQRKIVTIAGTNGKGSCVASLEALFKAYNDGSEASKNICYGSYTSPHFIAYNERIRLNGEDANDAVICQAFSKIEAAREEISLSYFEFATLAALQVFVLAGCDYIVLEVGLGGRLDAVNIIDADVAVVTSIALDHQDWLGSDLEQIAREKAGIFRAEKIAISASAEMPNGVAETARQLGAKHWQVQQDYSYRLENGRLHLRLAAQQLDIAKPGLPIPSVAAAALVVDLLGLWPGDEAFAEALSKVQLTGRCQRISWQGRELVLDVAHNPAASAHLRAQLEDTRSDFLLLAAMADKDLAGIIQPWVGSVKQAFCCDLPDTPRAATSELLYSQLQAAGITSQAFADFDAAFTQALNCSEEEDRIIIMGSFFTVAAALRYLTAIK